MDYFTSPRGEPDAFGNGKNTQVHRINLVMSTKPKTLHQISSKCGLSNTKRILQHMRFLIDSGFCYQEGDTWALTDGAAVTFFGES
jgi:predicted transcriptional regulator